MLANIRALMVARRRWMTEREFTNTITVSQMLPGGAAANALAYMGLRFGGMRGALLGYVGFVLPGWIAVMVLAFLYVRYGTAPDVATLLGGFNAAVVGIIGAITLKMVRSAVSRMWQMGLAAAALLFSVVGDMAPGEVALLSICVGLAVDLGTKRARLFALERLRGGEPPVVLPEEGATLATEKFEREGAAAEEKSDRHPARVEASALGRAGGVVDGVRRGTGHRAACARRGRGVDRILFSFFRTGLGAYGGGFAIIPHLKQVVAREGWLTDRQFADAVAMGKLTPGPVLLLDLHRLPAPGAPGRGGRHGGDLQRALRAGAGVSTWLDRVRSRRRCARPCAASPPRWWG